MSASAFFDTNVLVYLFSRDERKADRAEDLLARGGTISVGVLNEFAHVAIRKMRLSMSDIQESLRAVRSSCSVVPVDLSTHERGLALVDRYGLSMYGALIVASAIASECSIVYSEDFQDGQRFESVTIRNPFRSTA